MSALETLVTRWRQDAAFLRRRGALQAAETTEALAAELAETLRDHADDLVGPDVAAAVSGYTARRLRQLVAAGQLENHGKKGAPLYRRGDLPRKPSGAVDADAFDPEAEALDIHRRTG